MDTAQTLTRYARSFFFGTALSRFSGLFRDIAMAIAFGSSADVAAFFVAFRLANLFRRLLGEGNLQAGFVPQFSSMEEKGPAFFRDALFSLGAILLFTIALCEGLCFFFLQFATPDWALIIELTMWMLPGLFFICLFGLNTALLQCKKKYFLPAAAPIAFNFVWISAALLAPDVRILSMAVTLGFMGQWLATSFEGFSLLSLKEWLSPKFFSPECKLLLKQLSLGLIGVGAVQFNSALDPLFARIADLKAPAYLWYAIRLQQLPFALFGLGLSSALLPALSRTEDQEQRKSLLQSSLSKASSLMLFCTFAILALGRAGINLLFGHGDFTSMDVEETLYCLWGYGAGLVPSVFVLLLAARCYAEKDYKSPALASLWAVFTNIALNALFVFVFKWGAMSIAVATSISSLVNAALLAKGAFNRSFWQGFGKSSALCLGAASLCLIVEGYWLKTPPNEPFMQLLHGSVLGLLYLGVTARKTLYRSSI